MRIKLALVLLLALLPALMMAQSSGKLVGFAKDKSTDEPLPGVNIIIDGTSYGAATDVDGYFVILNVPVGSYDVRASFIGYRDQVLSGIHLSGGKTTEANFDLEEAAIEGEAVVITAEKPLVEKHITQSVSLITSEELENIPVRNFNSLISTQNSVVVQNDNVYIRGGRTEEVGYYLDGASVTDPLTNTQGIYIIKDAVEEFQIQAGGYTAEFGNANSGIVRTEMKTGRSNLNLSVDAQTDKFAGEGEQFLGTHSFRHHILSGTISGPLFNDKIRFFLAGENQFEGDYRRRFSEGFQFDGLIDTNPNADQNNPDTVNVQYPDGFTPLNERSRWALNSTLSFDLSPVRLRLSGAYNNSTTDFNRQPMLRILNERNFADENKSMLLSGKITHVISPTSLYEVQGSFFNSSLERVDDYFGGDWTQWWDSLAVAQHTGGAVQYAGRYNDPHDYNFNGFPFERNGAARNLYRIEKVNYISGSVSYTGQMGRHHELKVGVDAKRYTVRHYDNDPQLISLLESTGNTSLEDIDPGQILNTGSVNGYGYDHLGREIDSPVDYGNNIEALGPKKPTDVAAFVQDKIEYKDLIINFGLRYDYFDTDDRELIDPTNPEVDQNSNYILSTSWKDKDAFQQISPRLGFSFPVSDKTVFYLQYGKFIQKPELNDMYFGNSRYQEQIGVGGNFYNNTTVGFGLDPIRTTSYEIGFRQQLGSVAAMDVTGFYKNVRGQIQAQTISVSSSASVNNYTILANGDFATTQGLELSLNLRRVNRIQASLNYTLTNSEGTGSNETEYVGALNQGEAVPTIIQPLNFAQKHVGSVILDYRFGKQEGGFLSQLGLNALFNFSSGHPFTFVTSDGLGQVNAYDAGIDYMFDTRVRRVLEPIGSSSTPWTFNLDLNVDKSFNITQQVGVTVYSRITNLFNFRNVVNVYDRSGTADDDGFLSNGELSQSFINANGGQQYVDLYTALNLRNGQSYWDRLNRELWGNPRQVFFGIKLTY